MPDERRAAPVDALRTAETWLWLPWLPWSAARRLFAPKPTDGASVRELRVIGRLGFWRSLAGLAVVTVIDVGFGDAAPLSLADAYRDVVTNLVLAVVVGSVCVLALTIGTARGTRRSLVGGFRRLARTLLIAIVVVVGSVLVLFSVASASGAVGQPGGPSRSLLLLGLSIISLLAGAWFVAFVLCTLFWGARTVLWIAEVHPLLAPIGGAAVALLAFQLKATAMIGPSPTPPTVRLALAFVGVVTTTVLAVLEYRALARTGLRLRHGPGSSRPA